MKNGLDGSRCAELDRRFKEIYEEHIEKASSRSIESKIAAWYDQCLSGGQDKPISHDKITRIKNAVKNNDPIDIYDKFFFVGAFGLATLDDAAGFMFDKVLEKGKDKKLVTEYDGIYRFWRFRPADFVSTGADETPDNVPSGFFQLTTKPPKQTQNNVWSPDYCDDHMDIEEKYTDKAKLIETIKNCHPEYENGFSFMAPQKIFSISFSTSRVRLSIMKFQRSPTIDKFVSGLTMSIGSTGDPIFCSPFVACHESQSYFTQKNMSARDFIQKSKSTVKENARLMWV